MGILAGFSGEHDEQDPILSMLFSPKIERYGENTPGFQETEETDP
jgi:hypothetical protein